LNHCSKPGEQIKHEELTELLERQNNQLENLIQIYKQFTKLNSSHQGHIDLNKKLCLIECVKCYIEHLILFHKFELLIPPDVVANGSEVINEDDLEPSKRRMKNYLAEMKVNFKLIENRWTTRRAEQFDRLEPEKANYLNENERKYPFTYMIDCLIEECRLNSVVTKFLSKFKKSFKKKYFKNFLINIFVL